MSRLNLLERLIIGIRLFRANKSTFGKDIIILTPILIIPHGGIMIHGGDILIGGEDWASVTMAAIIGDIMVGTMAVDIMMEETMVVDIMVEEAMAVDMVVEEAMAVDMVVEEAMAVDMGDSWV